MFVFWITFSLLSCRISSNVQKALYFVPADAKPGHVVAELQRHVDQSSKLHPNAADPGISSYFTVLDKGSVITLNDVTPLKGRTISLNVLHQHAGEQWSEEILLNIADSIPTVQFTSNAYTGYIAENEAIGSKVQGLDDLWNSVASFPYGCVLALVAGDSSFFVVDGLSLVSTVSFNREATDSFYLTLQAHCAENIEAVTRVRVQIADVNDEAPGFERSTYTVDLMKDEVSSSPIIQVNLAAITYLRKIMLINNYEVNAKLSLVK